MPISKEEVIWGYRIFLDRDPESDQVIQQKMLHTSKLDLLIDFLYSAEFQKKHPDNPFEPAEAWVLVETPYHFRI